MTPTPYIDATTHGVTLYVRDTPRETRIEMRRYQLHWCPKQKAWWTTSKQRAESVMKHLGYEVRYDVPPPTVPEPKPIVTTHELAEQWAWPHRLVITYLRAQGFQLRRTSAYGGFGKPNPTRWARHANDPPYPAKPEVQEPTP